MSATITSARNSPALVQFGVAPLQVELRDVTVGPPARGDVLVRVAAASVCGSDVHQYHGTQSWTVRTPVVLGHEFGGTIEELGPGVTGFREGERVVCETAARICGNCVYCRSGRANLCPERLGFGWGIDGGMAELVVVPERCLHRIPDSLPFSVASLTEPCCVAYNAVVERSRIVAGDTVIVLGPGPIGILAAMAARSSGATDVVVAGLSRDAARLAVAREVGATDTVRLDEVDLAEVVRDLGDGLGADVVIDAAGVSASFGSAMEAVRPGGQITKVGWGPGPLGHTLDPIVRKAVTVNGSFSHTFTTWETVIRLIASGSWDVRPLMSLEAPLTDWPAAFDGMHSGELVKAVLTF